MEIRATLSTYIGLVIGVVLLVGIGAAKVQGILDVEYAGTISGLIIGFLTRDVIGNAKINPKT